MPERRNREGDNAAGDVSDFEYKKGFKDRSPKEYAHEGDSVSARWKGSSHLDKPPKCKVFTTGSLE